VSVPKRAITLFGLPATTTASRQARKTITPKQIAVAKARIDATAHRLARMAFMAKYAHAMPIAKNIAAERADILQAQMVGGSAKIPTELRYGGKVGSLGRRRQIADRHVLDHAAAKRAEQPLENLLSEGLGFGKPTILSDRR
jgi:hypothetical protein